MWLAVSENRQSGGQWSDNAAALESTATCRDRFGPLPVGRFALRTCAMCYVYLGNATHSRRLLPVPRHYEALARVDSNFTVTQVIRAINDYQKLMQLGRNACDDKA